MLADQPRELPLAIMKLVPTLITSGQRPLVWSHPSQIKRSIFQKGRPAFDQLADSKALEALFYVAVLIFTLITLGLAVVLRESPPL